MPIEIYTWMVEREFCFEDAKLIEDYVLDLYKDLFAIENLSSSYVVIK